MRERPERLAARHRLRRRGDGYGDDCPPVDSDEDGVVDSDDNAPRPGQFCASSANPGQEDADGDDAGDVCDRARDGDDLDNGYDNCPDTYNPDQADPDADGIGSLCDPEESLPGDGGGGPAGPGPSDGQPLELRLATPRRYALSTGSRSFPTRVRCSERCALEARIVVGKRVARRLGLGSRRRLAAGTWALGGPSWTYVFTGFGRRAARAVGRSRRPVRARVVVVATDAAGEASRRTRRISLRP